MILQALNEHYKRLLEDEESGVAPPGYSSAKVTHALILDYMGNIVDVLPLTIIRGRRNLPKTLIVPEQVRRTSGISANLLCDNASYVLGLERDKNGNLRLSKDKYIEFRQKNVNYLKNFSCNTAKALIYFLEKWEPQLNNLPKPIQQNLKSLLDGGNIVFKLDGEQIYIHEEMEIRKGISENKTSDEKAIGQCLITGKNGPIARLHPAIKGISGAQTSGASLVSFNVNSFTSYGKSQSYNAPVGEEAAFAYGTALNYLTASETNRVRLGDTTMVFWADKKGGKAEETILSWCIDPININADEEKGESRIDYETAWQAKTVLERIKSGQPIGDASFNLNSRCYILGLSPNAARLSVRFWQVSSFGDLLRKIAQHYKDMDIDGLEKIGGFISPWRILKAVAVQEDAKNIPPMLEGQLMSAILSGNMYPQNIYNSALIRCRTGGEHGGVSIIRAAIIKAFLVRKYRIQNLSEKEVFVTMGLNEKNTNTAYMLGRLFSLLEKVQKDALGSTINSTIRDRYFGAASTTPGAVFPLLLRLSRHHISKAENGRYMDGKIQEVMNGLDEFPAFLNMEEQGQFMLGYYHQNQANYAKRDNQII